ncbi:MAG: hypothetical protein ACKV2T_12705 [Kofleriaceae bacterium]
MSNSTLALSIALAGCASAIASPRLQQIAPKTRPSLDVAKLTEAEVAFARGRGAAALDELLARYDRLHEGAARDAFALRIDQVAAQRYATVSRLYWHTNLDRAKAVAKQQQKPILSLRMLGRLDEDLSCANSRFFRATLYANKDLSAFLRDNFVLHWSSDRAVPKVTIDFGDGRTIASTTTGNSAHYILDENGGVLDVIPGLYAPHAFRAELATSLAHAKSVAAAPASERGAKRTAYHQAKVAQISAVAEKLQAHMLFGRRVSAEEALSRAQRATISKGYVEVPQLRQITTAELETIDENEVATWALFADQLWPRTKAYGDAVTVNYVEGAVEIVSSAYAPRTIFDAQSLALVERLHGDAPAAERTHMLTRLARHALADSALNQIRLRTEIAAILSDGNSDFTKVNDVIYAAVFHTPKSDPWLGLRARRDFTGLPNDGASGSTAEMTPVAVPVTARN